jgi:nonsense-mediated mRNA decay protein 3
MFCVECGREVGDEVALVGGLCLECFLERNPLLKVPEVVDLVRCPHCGAMKAKGGWREPADPAGGPKGHRKGRSRKARRDAAAGAAAAVDDDGAAEAEAMRLAVTGAVEDAMELIEGASLQSLAFDVVQEDRRSFIVRVKAELSMCGESVTQDLDTHVRLRPEACPVCSRRMGSYYEAIVQFRGARSRSATEADLASARGLAEGEGARLEAASREAHIVKVEELKGGLDFYVSTQSAGSQLARTLASRFGASISSTTTLAGRKEGRDLLRTTHLVRMPDIRPGDYVLYDGELHRVQSSTDKEALLVPVPGEGRRRTVSRSDREGLVLVGVESDVTQAVVVSSSAGEVQLLDPESFKTVELRTPPGFSPGGRETLGVVRHEGRLMIAR